MNITDENQMLAEIARLVAAMRQPVPSGWGPYEYLFSSGEFRHLEHLLAQAPELADFANRRTCYLGTGGIGLSVDQLARWLVTHASANSASAAMVALRSFLECTHIPCRFVYGLVGVTAQTQVSITDQVSIIPFTMSDLKPSMHTNDSWAPIARMTGGIALDVMYPKTIVAGSDPAASQAGVQMFQETFAYLERVRLCLGLVKPSPSAVVIETYLVPDNPGISSATTNRSRYTADWIEPVLYSDADGARAAEILALVSGSSEKLRTRLQVALRRFQTGMAKIPAVDSAIDLGIILETIYLPDSNAELTYRLRVRAAKLLGRDAGERRELMKRVGKVYDVRSTAVHSGVLPSKSNIPGLASVEEVIRYGYKLAADSIIEVMKRKIDDWDEFVAS
jgi:hypothetical protein